MTIKFHIGTDQNCVFILHLEDYRPGLLREQVDRIAKNPEYQVGMNFLNDARQISVTKSSETNVGENRERLKKFDDPQLGKCRIAWLVGNAADFGFMHRMSVTNRFNDKVERRPFREIENALGWLNIPKEFKLDGLSFG